MGNLDKYIGGIEQETNGVEKKRKIMIDVCGKRLCWTLIFCQIQI